MNISTNYSQTFTMTNSSLNSAKNRQNQQQSQIKNDQSATMYIGKKNTQNKEDNRIEELMKRKEEIQKRISEIQSGQGLQGKKDNNLVDPKAIKEKIKELEASITEIESTIATIKQENKEEERTKNLPKTAEKSSEEAIIDSSRTLDQIKQKHSQQVGMEGQANILKSEIKKDKALGVDTTLKQKQLSNINLNVKKLDISIGEDMKRIYKDDNSDEDDKNEEGLEIKDGSKSTNKDKDLIHEYSKNTEMLKEEENKSKVNVEV